MVYRLVTSIALTLLMPPALNISEPPAEAPLPQSANITIPFTAQAPYGNWSQPFLDACEEAAVLMAHRFIIKQPLTPEIARNELLKIVAWEMKTFGYFKDTNAEETARILRELFGYERVEVVYDFSIEAVKYHVANNHPVIIPAAGRFLKNPYFKPPGPRYHMFVIRGFTEDGKIITNEPGTKRGENFIYDAERIMEAAHDFNNGDVEHGAKVMIAVYPNA